MSSLNEVNLIGNLGRAPEVRRMSDGTPVCNFTLATTDRWTKDGERKEKTEWHRIVIWNEKLCEIAERYLTVGSKVYVSGKLETRQWEDKAGRKNYTTEIVLRYGGRLILLDGKPDSPAKTNDLDDEIPF